jgi:hypothetical protein
MRSVLSKLPWRASLGIYVDGNSITLSALALTPFGSIEIDRSQETSDKHLADLVASVRRRSKSKSLTVGVAICTKDVFHSTRPLHSDVSTVQPRQLLREALHADQSRASQMAVDALRACPVERNVLSLAACEQSLIDSLKRQLGNLGLALSFAEPAPCALLRSATLLAPAPRGVKLVLRVFLGEKEGLGVLVSGRTPLIWRKFWLTRGDEGSGLLSIARSMEPVGKYCGVDARLEMVIIHGRPDLHPLLSRDWLEDQIGTAVKWVDRPGFSPEEIAYGTAIEEPSRRALDFNFVRTSSPVPKIRQVIPWGQLVLHILLLAWVGSLHCSRLMDLRSSLNVQERYNASHPELGSHTDAQLNSEKKELQTRLAAVRKFSDSRIAWHPAMRTVAECLSENLYLTSWQGWNELERPGKNAAKPKRSLILQGSALLADDGTAAQQIEVFVDSLREMTYLRRELPIVAMENIQGSSDMDERPISNFTVTFAPNAVPKLATDDKKKKQ